MSRLALWQDSQSAGGFPCREVSARDQIEDGSGNVLVVRKANYAATAAPTVDDDSSDGYGVGSRWVDIVADAEYVCLDATVGAAVWTQTTGGGAPVAHATSHENGGSDEISVAGLTGLLATAQTPADHKTTHENNGGDEISVSGLSGVLADPQTPATHAGSHQNGGGDALKLDDLGTPDDNTDLNATTSVHGLLPKLGGGTTNFLRADGSWAAPSGGGVADTKSPKGTWATVTTVNFAARLGQPSTTRLTLQDGTQRTSTGTLAWAVANGVADLGYDEAASQGNSKWLYFYYVPSAGDDAVGTVRASDNPPSVGPTGYSNWKLIWAAYIDGSGNLLETLQVGRTFYFVESPAPGLGVTAKTHYDASLYCPETAAVLHLQVRADYGSAAAAINLYLTGATARQGLVKTEAAHTPDTGRFEIPIGGSPRGFDYEITGTGTAGTFYMQGWTDEWIDP